MCGRFAFYSPKEAVLDVFGVELPFDPAPHYNVAPTQLVAAIRAGRNGLEGAELRWGLVPFWAKDPSIGNRLINARAETLAEKPAFREAFQRRRCAILASGFYEWRKGPSGRTPYFIAPRDGLPIAFAGLWERWRQGDRQLETCTVVTTDANRALHDLHERMPVILSAEAVRVWVDPQQPVEAVAGLLRPAPEEQLAFHAVSRAVNSPANEGEELIAEVPG
jgi:putative SOS response-associated peptidase YedK